MVRNWLVHLLGPFLISTSLVVVLAGQKWRIKPKYLATLSAALAVTVLMGLVLNSPWIGTVMVSAMVGVAFRYW
jgi:hypothetical protein